MQTQEAQPAKTPKAAAKVQRKATPKPAPVKPAKDVEAKAKAQAEKAAAEAKAKAKEAEKAATEKEKEKEATRLKTETKLEPVAKEILYRLEQAAKMDDKASDHRLSACIQFTKAKEMCDVAGINFKEWSAKHIPNQSYETVRQMVRIGSADDPKLALADLRKGNAERNKAARKKAAKRGGANIGKDESGPAPKAATPFQRVEAALAEMPEGAVKELIASQAGEFGLQVISDKELKALKTGATRDAKVEGKKGEPAWKAVLDAYTALPKTERTDFLFELEQATGYKLVPAKEFKEWQAAQGTKKAAQ